MHPSKIKGVFVHVPLSCLDNTTRPWPPAPSSQLTTAIMYLCDKSPVYTTPPVSLTEPRVHLSRTFIYYCLVSSPRPQSHRRISGKHSFTGVLDSPQHCIMFRLQRNVMVSQRDEVLTYNYSPVGPWHGGVRPGQLGQHPAERLFYRDAVTQQN